MKGTKIPMERWRIRIELPAWGIILLYVFVTVLLLLLLPRLEFRYLPSEGFGLSPNSALAICGAVASGMLALMGIVFSLSFVMIQFSSAAYSPRLVQWFARDPVVTHSTGVFASTFLYALGTSAWIDREGSGVVPMASAMLVFCLLLASVFMFVHLVRRMANLQITKVLTFIGDQGREVIAQSYGPLREGETGDGGPAEVPPGVPVSQVMTYTGRPRVIASLDVTALAELARQVGGVIRVRFAVGGTIMEGDALLRVYGGKASIPEKRLRRSVYLAEERTFEQDPKYALRLLVDVAIKALSPAINDPTTAVQALDQVEDNLRRLGNCNLAVGRVTDREGAVRLVFPTPSWEDLLNLGFDEIRQCGATSVQVMRRMRNAMKSIAKAAPQARRAAVERQMARLDATVGRSYQDLDDRADALQEDRQGLGVPDRPEEE
jgi:uncharacterized membrane protein